MVTAVSDLGKAIGKPIVGLGERSTADESYDAAMQRIESLLAQRENKPYNPTLLAIAQGMLAPSATGSFGEGIGAAAGNVMKVQEQEQKQAMENAQMRLQLAQAQKEQAQKQGAMKFLSGDQPSGQADQVGKGDASGPAVRTSQGMMTPRQISIISVGNKTLGDILAKEYQMTIDAYKTQQGGFLDVAAPGGPKYTPYGGKATVERFIPGDQSIGRQAMKVPMPEEAAIKLDKALEAGDAKTYYAIVDQFTTPLARPVATGAPGSPGSPGSPDAVSGAAPVAGGAQRPVARTPQELDKQLEVEKAGAVTTVTETAKSAAERTNSAYDASKSARAMQASYDRANEIMADPRIKDYIGVLRKGDVTSALGNLVNEAFRIGNYSVGIPAIKQVLTESKAPLDIIDKLAELGQIEAIWQMESRKSLGAGTSVSNMEQVMANRISPSQDDPYNAYMQKLRYLQEKANFQIELARGMRRNKMGYDEFEDTKDFDKIFNAYRKSLMNIVSPMNTGKPPASGAPAPSPAGQSIKDRVNASERKP